MIRNIALSLLLVVITSPAMAAMITATASLDGLQEVPPNDSAATGTATFTIDDVTGGYEFMLDVDGIDVFEIKADAVGGIHIHEAPVGSNGGIVINVASDRTSLAIPAFGMFSMTSAGVVDDLGSVLAALAAGDLYINVHTEEYAGGEIRGQLAVVPLPGAFLLFGSAIFGLLAVKRRQRA
ncbi:CHRD domain-containing protein [Halieaceae bacterium IMCC14734]|uniref:CHRD domain-containing protein n=1 Tax=Candidatus Litorirhabdus singularis TaxID=2518993 RepID=A0ABT3TEQ2_9GAMM|nr:CHRD domain-containing protein [Candidatus Litorirhabdus singularis]MCX2980763.1 CHRD domain-containing protein [Candidatus Litorirhabdus singularis]